MAVLEADQHRGAGGGGLVIAFERLAGLDQREGLRGLDAERLEHLGGEDLAHPALQRQPAVAEAAIGGLTRTLGAEIEQAAAGISELREQEAAAVADIGIVHAELVAVIAQRQRRRRDCPARAGSARNGRSTSSSPSPSSPTEAAARSLRKLKDRPREGSGRHGIVKGLPQVEDARSRGGTRRVADRPSSVNRRRSVRGYRHGRVVRWLLGVERRPQAPLPGLCRRREPAADHLHPRPDPQRARLRRGCRAAGRRLAGDLRRAARPRRERLRQGPDDLCAADLSRTMCRR